jgi:putative copper export protein
MTEFELLKWIHLLAAATWTGGLIVLAFLVGAARKAGADVEILRVLARRFGVVSWTAMAVAVLAGLRLYTLIGLPWADFALKGTLIALSIGVSLFHHFTARRTSPAMRGLQQAIILVLAVGIFGAAVLLA